MRQLKVLIDGLPSHSLYKAKLRGVTDGQRWGDLEYLLAFIADMLQAQYGVAYVGVTHKQPPQMAPYPRPEMVERGTAEAAQANARAEEYLELLANGALAGQKAPGESGWISGTPADRVRLLPSGVEQLPETGGATTT
jgi:hypothetical protein